MAHLTEQDQAVLAERFIDVPWCVYAQGLDEAFCCERAPHTHPPRRIGDCPEPFTRTRAIDFAESLRACADAATAIRGAIVPEVTAFMLWHGIAWVVR